MVTPVSFGTLDFKIVSSMEEEPQGVPEPETPFRIAIFGDFSGRASRGVFDPGSALIARRPVLVDRDNFDEVLAGMGVEIHVPVAGKDSPPVAIRFTELDDFHPDTIFERLEVFQALRDTRTKLDDPRTFAKAAEEVRSWAKNEIVPEPLEEDTARPSQTSEIPAGDIFDQVLDKTEGSVRHAKPELDLSDLSGFLRKIVQPYLVPKADPEQEELVAVVDKATAELMSTIMHHPDFQAIESAWRGVHFLVSGLQTDAELKLYLVDISKDELAVDLNATEDLRITSLYKVLLEKNSETAEKTPWAVVAGNYTFTRTREDAQFLGRMAKISSLARAPFISAAHATVLGCESFDTLPDPDDWKYVSDVEDGKAWEALRKLPESSYIGLALPRFLLRLPYGEETDPTEAFCFEEMPIQPEHESYLWGNPSFACVYLLGQAFSHYGWNLRPGAVLDINGLPLHVYKEQGESKTKPCAEMISTDRAVEIILDKGFMPFISFLNQDTIRLVRFQSIADPATHLAGRWC